ncbi:hypothetical protein D3C80_1555820 [compost metagenome]
MFVEFGHMGATARQDGHQVPTLEDQQGFTHRAATDVQCLGDLLLLDTLSRFELAADDPLGQVVGNLLGEAVRRLERHGFPSKSLNCAKGAIVAHLPPRRAGAWTQKLAAMAQKIRPWAQRTMLYRETPVAGG